MTIKAASDLAKRRWKGISAKQRSKLVPHNGGRKRIYPPCPRYNSHHFSPNTGRCPCGFERPERRTK